MATTFPSTDLQIDITAPTNLASALKEGGAEKGGPFYMMDPNALDELGDFNVRIRRTEEWEEQVLSLMDSIRENGFMADKPISVVADTGEDGKPKLWVVDGHTRLEAVARLTVEGVEIEKIPVVVKPKSTTFEDMLVHMVASNTGKPFTPYEMSIVVKRLQNYGWDDERIGKRLGISKQTVSNYTVLAGAPAKIRNKVVAGSLSASEAIKIIREHGAQAPAVVAAAAEQAAADGKKRITGASVRKATGDTAPRKTGKSPALVAPYEPANTLSADDAYAKLTASLAKGEPTNGVVADEDGPPAALTEASAGGIRSETVVSASLCLAAIDYALTTPADGLAWLRLWRAGDPDTLAELQAATDPDGGL